MSVPNQERLDLARTYLRLGREDYDRATRNRIYYARLARREGMTNQEIGDLLGLTESGVRRLLQRAAAQVS